MELLEAIKTVEKNIGECVAIYRHSAHSFTAIAYRKDHRGHEDESFSYSTHDVYRNGCEAGHYDMDFYESRKDFAKRIGNW